MRNNLAVILGEGRFLVISLENSELLHLRYSIYRGNLLYYTTKKAFPSLLANENTPPERTRRLLKGLRVSIGSFYCLYG